MVDKEIVEWKQYHGNLDEWKLIENADSTRQKAFDALRGSNSNTEELLRNVNNSVKNFEHLTNSERLDILLNMAEIMWLEATFSDDDWNIDVDCNDMWIGSFEDDLHLSKVWWEVWPISWAHFSLPNDNRSPNEYWTVDIYIHTDWIIRVESQGEFIGKFSFEQWKQALNVANNCLSNK